jgi:uncharacterized protein (TIGR03437 family)
MQKLLLSIGLAAPVLLFAFSSGPPIRRTGAAVDGGQTCTACHQTYAPANSDPRGRVTLLAGSYTPGVKQLIWVTVEHPEARRWGFQLTARLASDETKPAGTFTPTSAIRVRCDPTGADAPCNGALEFASHVRESTQAGTLGRGVFAVEWTPPASDAGDVVFYAAGNAADGNGASSGDRIYTTSLRIPSAGCGSLTARPTITRVTNAGSYRDEAGIAMNTMVAIYGTNFAVPGTARQAIRSDLVDGVYPRTLACASVEIAGQTAPVTFVSPTQINVQAPTGLLAGPVDVEVKLNRNTPAELKAEKQGVLSRFYSPAFFQFLPSSSIAAQIAPNFEILASPNLVPGGRPIKPGEVAILYGTGFGPTEPVYQRGEIAQGPAPIRDPYTVRVGGVTLTPAEILYGGLSPGSISGLYQFNIRIPANTPDGDIPVEIEIGGLKTQPGVTIPVKR